MTPHDSFVTGVDFVSGTHGRISTAQVSSTRTLSGSKPGPRWQRPGHPAMGAEFETGTVTIAIILCKALGIEFSPHQGADRAPRR